MLSFKQFNEQFYNKDEEAENAKKSNLKHTKHGDWNITVVNHAGSQAYLRRTDMKPEHWAEMHKNIANHIARHGAPRGENVFYSNKHKQGAVIEVTPHKKEIKYISALPKGKSDPRHGSRKYMIEQAEMQVFFIE